MEEKKDDIQQEKSEDKKEAEEKVEDKKDEEKEEEEKKEDKKDKKNKKKEKEKKEEENTEKEKQLKAYVTFQNLLNIGKRNENNINIMKIEPKISANKIRKESNKERIKTRKEPNEYYVGTESSKNNSTFIDKKEYYISILESKNFVNNQTKISKLEEEKGNENINNEDKISIENNENDKRKNIN